MAAQDRGSSGGVRRLHLVIGGRSAGAKKKPLMLFLHGFPELWYSWRHQMPVLSLTCPWKQPRMRCCAHGAIQAAEMTA
jgi:pimeloyl-ACP methyl ester carboxylesterase